MNETAKIFELLIAGLKVVREAVESESSHELRLAHIHNIADKIRADREARNHDEQKKFFGNSDFPKSEFPR